MIKPVCRGKFMEYFEQPVDTSGIMYYGVLKKFSVKDILHHLVSLLYIKEWVLYVKPSFDLLKQAGSSFLSFNK